jgi:DNA-binding response OmpR family regulator
MAVKRILVVDDEQPIRDLLREALTEAGFEVHTAADSDQALGLIRDMLFDAAILDFVLPDMNGIQLHSEIRRLDTDLAQRTLFISGVDQTDEWLKYYDDAGGFVAKPFDVAALVAQLEELVQG